MVRFKQTGQSPATVVAAWLKNEPDALIAIDAPLGWPCALAETLSTHRAGAPLQHAANAMFSRETDWFIFNTIGKKPLEVGAALIARAAHGALRFLSELRELTGRPIPLAWAPVVGDTTAIEVYPGATMMAAKIEAKEYKRNGEKGEPSRRSLVGRLAGEASIPARFDSILFGSDDAIDSVVCAIAGHDFIRGRSIGPPKKMSEEIITREGWIWARGGPTSNAKPQ